MLYKHSYWLFIVLILVYMLLYLVDVYCRNNLHIVLCMSPVGNAFRSRCRMFPSLVNCCTIDWFIEWPREALLSVSKSAFEPVDFGSDALKVSFLPVTLIDWTLGEPEAECRLKIVCLHAAPQVCLSINAGNGWPHKVLLTQANQLPQHIIYPCMADRGSGMSACCTAGPFVH